MKREHHLVNNLCFIVTFIKITSGEICYGAEFSEDVVGCPDFENEYLICDTLRLGMVEGKEAELGLNGVIEVFSDIDEGAEMGLEIWKITDIGKEFLYHMQGSICENLKNEAAPWYPMIQSMKIYDCPIVPDKYIIKDMSISLNNSKDMMNHELIGEYMIDMILLKDLKKVSCYQLGVTVTEYDC
ncbi:uncharacterized protein [Choristoneura fumiferana]|uniref:uncharacterized protein n=1 Tax=Choristoneura fumiferana TaxID=7141 RepID=UPI003D159086